MRILALLPDAYGANGGMGKVNRDVIEALCAAPGIEEVVVLPRNQRRDPPAILPGNLTYRVEAAGSRSRFARALGGLLLTDRDFDLVLCGHLHLLPLATLAARLAGTPVWLVVHGIEAWSPSRHLIANRLAGRVDRCVAVSDHTRRCFTGWSGLPMDRTTVISNCVDLDRFTPGPKREVLIGRYGLEGRRVILTFGRLAGEGRAKGFDRVLEVLPRLARRIPDVAYLIAGTGGDRARLERKAAALGVGHRVVFTGYVPEHEKVDHYRLADVFAMPSRGEGFGIAVIEALACGIPVVASAADGTREAVLDGELGAVVDPDDPEVLVGALTAALRQRAPTDRSRLTGFGPGKFRARWQAELGLDSAGA